ncbi:alpha/beta hydrolase [Streptomyces sp. NPDC049954]|uniref:alpha/beta hydrolase n=1 Tax=Streptomyces sp. NPDC049954 TaxID=3155779 RepID=UPI00343B920A
MTSFDSSPQLNVWRAALALAVVFIMLATTGWTAVRDQRGNSGPLQAAVNAWEHGSLDGRALPSATAPPDRLHTFFSSLDARQRDRLVRSYPLAVGNMNGAPVTLRYRANHLAMEKARGVEAHRIHDPRLSADGRADARDRMQRFTSMLGGDRHFLAFDPSGSGRIAEVFGDLARARRVSVVVPGVDTALMTFERGDRPFTAPVGMARSLYAAERAAGPGTRTAVIAWADYTAPEGIGMDAATAMRAEDGATRLTALIHALPGSGSVALVCHSYGSVLCGVAARSLPDRVTDIAVAGSPGMRTRSADQLGTPARIWATRDNGDWIRDIPHLEFGGLGHGADPVSEGFGARLMSAHGAVGHGGYFVPGTTSLKNFAEIGVGAYHSVICQHGNKTCRQGQPGAAA